MTKNFNRAPQKPTNSSVHPLRLVKASIVRYAALFPMLSLIIVIFILNNITNSIAVVHGSGEYTHISNKRLCYIQSSHHRPQLSRFSTKQNTIHNFGVVGSRIHHDVKTINAPSSTGTLQRSSHLLRDMTDPFQQLLIADATSTTTLSDSASMILTDNMNNDMNSIGMLSPEATTIVFIIGVIPFIIATYEFWRRIAVGATFGTGTDSVVFPTTTTIGVDNDPSSSRGKQVLGTDSLITAYIIFATVAVVLGIVFYSVITSPIPQLPPPTM